MTAIANPYLSFIAQYAGSLSGAGVAKNLAAVATVVTALEDCEGRHAGKAHRSNYVRKPGSSVSGVS